MSEYGSSVARIAHSAAVEHLDIEMPRKLMVALIANMRNKLFLISLLAFATLGSSQECKKRPDLIAACYVVHGRAQYGNGTPALRIWHVGTKHKYGVFPDNPSAVPKKLLDALSTFDHSVYGDYELCPLTQEKMGVMTMVCIESAKNLVVTESGTTKLVKQQGKPVSTR